MLSVLLLIFILMLLSGVSVSWISANFGLIMLSIGAISFILLYASDKLLKYIEKTEQKNSNRVIFGGQSDFYNDQPINTMFGDDIFSNSLAVVNNQTKNEENQSVRNNTTRNIVIISIALFVVTLVSLVFTEPTKQTVYPTIEENVKPKYSKTEILFLEQKRKMDLYAIGGFLYYDEYCEPFSQNGIAQINLKLKTLQLPNLTHRDLLLHDNDILDGYTTANNLSCSNVSQNLKAAGQYAKFTEQRVYLRKDLRPQT